LNYSKIFLEHNFVVKDNAIVFINFNIIIIFNYFDSYHIK